MRDYLVQEKEEFRVKMANSRAPFIEGDSAPFVTFLEYFLQGLPIPAVEDQKEAGLRASIASFWQEGGRCLPELSLVLDPSKGRYNRGYNGYLDLFVTSDGHIPRTPAIELKSIPLRDLWKGTRPRASEEPTWPNDLEEIREMLRDESEQQLLLRKYCYFDKSARRWCTTSIQELKERAVTQAKMYLSALKEGKFEGPKAGIDDPRVRCDKGEDVVDAYVLLCIGGTRILIWNIGTEQTK